MPQQDTKRNESQNRPGSENRQSNQQSLTPGQQRQGWLAPYGFGFAPGDLLRTNPFAIMRRMSEEIERAFSGFEQRISGGWMPAIEVSQQGNDYIVSAELPGIDPNDVKVEIEQNSIVLRGERQWQNEEERGGGIRHTERRYGSFYRAIPLPEGADPQQVRAHFENGLLQIHIPIKEEASRRRQIPVESGGSQTNAQTTSAGSECASSGQNRQPK